MDPNKVDTVRDWPVPKSKHEVQSFLGLCSYYWCFVKSFTTIAKPLHELTETFSGSESDQALRPLKIALCLQPILGFPASEGRYIVDTDASNTGLGAVLSQVQNAEERVMPVSYTHLDVYKRQL